MHRAHRNKYAHLSKSAQEAEKFALLHKAKILRHLPVSGKPGQVIVKGLRVLWHGRMYELTEDAVIPKSGDMVYKLFRLCRREI